jgi:hypothetical protein
MLFRGLLAEPRPWGRRSVAPIQADSTATLNIQGGRFATERDEFQRVLWRVTVVAVVDPESLVFVDEMELHTSFAPLYGYAPRCERLHLPVPRNRGKNTTLLSSMTTGGMGPSLAVEGATTARVFETYVEKVLVPSLRVRQIVVMDKRYAQKLWIEDSLRNVVYLPFEQSNGEPTLARRREGDTDGEDTPG